MADLSRCDEGDLQDPGRVRAEPASPADAESEQCRGRTLPNRVPSAEYGVRERAPGRGTYRRQRRKLGQTSEVCGCEEIIDQEIQPRRSAARLGATMPLHIR